MRQGGMGVSIVTYPFSNSLATSAPMHGNTHCASKTGVASAGPAMIRVQSFVAVTGWMRWKRKERLAVVDAVDPIAE
jgi:hypothetical protein